MRSEPIWHPKSSRTFPCVYLRGVFALSERIETGSLRCAGSGPFQVYLNGEMIGRGMALTPEPVWEAFEIGDSLHPGENRLLIVAWEGEGASWFRAEGEITFGNGRKVELGTGSFWEAMYSDVWEQDGETSSVRMYFAVREPVEWENGEFREGEWTEAAVVPAPDPLAWSPRPVAEEEVWPRQIAAFGEVMAGGDLEFTPDPGKMATCKCVHREALLRAGRQHARVQTRDPERAVYLVIDFGRPITGLPRLRLRGRKGGVIDLGFARRWGRIESRMRYVSSEGWREWIGFFLETFRYVVVRMENWPEEGEIDCISVVERRAWIPTQGLFRTGEELEQIWEIGRKSVEHCRQEIYYPVSKAGNYDWLKAYSFSLNDFYLTGNGDTAAAMLESARLPRTQWQGMAYALLAEAWFRYFGEEGRVEALLPDILRWFEEWDDLPDDEEGEGEKVARDALYAGALSASARLCRALKKREESAGLDRRYRQVRKRLQQAWHSERGLFADQYDGEAFSFSQWTQSLILYFDLTTRERQQAILSHVWGEQILRVDDLTQAFFLVGGLWQAGADERAVRYMRRQWGHLCARKGGTWGEKVDQDAVDPLPGPEFFLGSRLLGVRPAAPGYRRLEIRPHPSGLITTEGRVFTRRGSVSVEWRRRERQDDFLLRVELPEEVRTHLALPRLGKRFPTLILNGENVWRNEKVYPNPFVQEVISEEEWIVLVLHRGGEYEALVS